MITSINKENFIIEMSNAINSKYAYPVAKNIMKEVLYILESNTLQNKIELMDINVWMANCCAILETNMSLVTSKSRLMEYVYIRNAFSFLMINLYKLKQEEACKHLNLSRSTISTSCVKAKEDLETKNQRFVHIYNVCYNELFKQSA